MISVEEAVKKFYEHLPKGMLWRLYKSNKLEGYLIHSNYVTINGCCHLIGFDGSFVSKHHRLIKEVNDYELVYSRKLIFAFAKQWRDYSQKTLDGEGGIALCDDGSLYQINYMESFDVGEYKFLTKERILANEIAQWLKSKKLEIDSMPEYIENNENDSDKAYFKCSYFLLGKEVEIFKPKSFELGEKYLAMFLDKARKYYPDVDKFVNW